MLCKMHNQIVQFESWKEEKESILYSLSDFGTSGKNGVRNGENYLKNYFINKYGAITDVDFSDIFEKYMNQERK